MNEVFAPIVGTENVLPTEEGWLVTPPSQTQMAKVVELCHQNRWAVGIRGRGSKWDWGYPLGKVEVILSTAKLDRLIDHAVGDLTVTIEAGMKFQTIQTILAQSAQCLAIDPPYPDRATVGGIVATGDSGSLRHRYNSVRDQILGIQFIRADGEIVKAGGRVVKNVAGYDLMKLLTGSYGTLGIITAVTFRLYPLFTDSAFWLCQGDPAAISKLRSVLLQSSLTPTILDLYSPYLLGSLGYPATWGIGIEFAGISTEFQGNVLKEIAQTIGVDCQLVDTNFNRSVAAVFENYGRCKVGVPSNQALELFTPIADRYPMQIHLGSGLGLLLMQDHQHISTYRDKLTALGGFLTVLTGDYPDRYLFNPGVRELMIKLKQKFDPYHLLNPNRYGM
jgi:glycolate oxidase FAD binding subunit